MYLTNSIFFSDSFSCPDLYGVFLYRNGTSVKFSFNSRLDRVYIYKIHNTRTRYFTLKGHERNDNNSPHYLNILK